MAEYPYVRAAFINAIAEEGTKEEAVSYLQKQWNETCALRAEIERLKADLQKAHEGWQAEVAVIRSIADDNLARAEKVEAERDEALAQLDDVLAIFGQRVTGRDTMTGEPLFWGDDKGDCLSPKDAILEAIETRDCEKMREGMRMAVDKIMDRINNTDFAMNYHAPLTSFCKSILAAMEKEGGE